jgi:hypothetical protein
MVQPIPNRILQPTPQEFDQALAVLHPHDHAGLLELAEKPDTPFSLIRRFIEPDPEVMDAVQHGLAVVMQASGGLVTWNNAAVKKVEYTGATYFDGEPTALTAGDVFKNISPFALAVKKCAALTQIATQPAAGKVEKFITGSQTKRRIYVGLGMLCEDEVLRDYNAADAVGHQLLFTGARTDAGRIPAHLAYILEEKPDGPRSSFVPAGVMKKHVEGFIPVGSPVQLDRVRLVVHSDGNSPYDKLK